jgi:hypothetical protein
MFHRTLMVAGNVHVQAQNLQAASKREYFKLIATCFWNITAFFVILLTSEHS